MLFHFTVDNKFKHMYRNGFGIKATNTTMQLPELFTVAIWNYEQYKLGEPIASLTQ